MIGAIILRAACSAFNKLSQPQNHVPEPEMGKAMLITFVTTIVNSVLGFVLGLVFGTAMRGAVPPDQIQIVAQFMSLPLSMLVMAG